MLINFRLIYYLTMCMFADDAQPEASHLQPAHGIGQDQADNPNRCHHGLADPGWHASLVGPQRTQRVAQLNVLCLTRQKACHGKPKQWQLCNNQAPIHKTQLAPGD